MALVYEPERDFYKLLGLTATTTASEQVVRQAYLKCGTSLLPTPSSAKGGKDKDWDGETLTRRDPSTQGPPRPRQGEPVGDGKLPGHTGGVRDAQGRPQAGKVRQAPAGGAAPRCHAEAERGTEEGRRGVEPREGQEARRPAAAVRPGEVLPVRPAGAEAAH